MVLFPGLYLLLLTEFGILSECQSLWGLDCFAICKHIVLTEALGLELKRRPSDFSFRYYFFKQVDV